MAAVAAALPALRLTALELLGAALGGDMLAAEYLLLQLVSRCAHKQDSIPISRGEPVAWVIAKRSHAAMSSAF